MPLISHGRQCARCYVIALSGKSLNNSHPTAALATKLGHRYIVSFPPQSVIYLSVETSLTTTHLRNVHDVDRWSTKNTIYSNRNEIKTINTILKDDKRYRKWKQVKCRRYSDNFSTGFSVIVRRVVLRANWTANEAADLPFTRKIDQNFSNWFSRNAIKRKLNVLWTMGIALYSIGPNYWSIPQLGLNHC